MNILIIGNSEDAHAKHIKEALEQAGANTYYFDTHLFPTQLRLSWQPDNHQGSLILPEGQRLDIKNIHSVYWRNFSGVYIPSLSDENAYRIALNDATSTLRSFLQACPARWVNSWQAYQFHQEKPLQLSKAKELGAQIPQTLISNDPEEVIRFSNSLEKAIFKPVYGGAHTKLVTTEHLEPKRLNLTLSISPVVIQEYIAGTNIRIYVISDSIFGAEIRSSELDFREDNQAKLIPIEVPTNIQKLCLEIARAFMLEWTAMDWRLTPQGEFIFLEANPSPMFIYFEKQTNFPITQKLIELLMN